MGEEGVSQGVDPPLGYRFLPTSQLMPIWGEGGVGGGKGAQTDPHQQPTGIPVRLDATGYCSSRSWARLGHLQQRDCTLPATDIWVVVAEHWRIQSVHLPTKTRSRAQRHATTMTRHLQHIASWGLLSADLTRLEGRETTKSSDGKKQRVARGCRQKITAQLEGTPACRNEVWGRRYIEGITMPANQDWYAESHWQGWEARY